MKKKPPAYPQLDLLLGAYFGEDFELAGNTIEEIVGCYKGDSPIEFQQALRNEIVRFRQAHPYDLDAAFLTAYEHDFNPPLWGHTTDSFLTELDRLLREQGLMPPPP